MKKTTRLLLAAGVLLLAAGCKDSDEPTVVPPPDGTQFSETFIQQYLAPSGIELSARTINDPSTTCIHVRFDGELYTPGSEQFATLSEAYGDTSYNNPLVPFSNLALAETIRAVSVRWTPLGAAADGTRTLDAVTHIGTASLYAFVRNGYRDDAEAFPDALSFLGCYQNTATSRCMNRSENSTSTIQRSSPTKTATCCCPRRSLPPAAPWKSD